MAIFMIENEVELQAIRRNLESLQCHLQNTGTLTAEEVDLLTKLRTNDAPISDSAEQIRLLRFLRSQRDRLAEDMLNLADRSRVNHVLVNETAVLTMDAEVAIIEKIVARLWKCIYE